MPRKPKKKFSPPLRSSAKWPANASEAQTIATRQGEKEQAGAAQAHAGKLLADE